MTISPEALERFELFSGLPAPALSAIAPHACLTTHPDGFVLFSEGSLADTLYLIVSGRLSLEKRVQLGRTGTPRRAAIEVVGLGQVAGWSSLVPPHTYTASGVCQGETAVLAIPGEALRQVMSAQPESGYTIAMRVAAVIRHRLASTTDTLTYFLSVVSHELKRPLAAVENYIQIMLGGFGGEVDDKQRRLLERSALRLSDLRALISDILDFARLQPDQIQADFEWVDPQQVGAEAIEEVRLAASQKGIRLKAGGPARYQPILAARRRLRQVLSNLLANAVKFSPEGSTVALTARDEPARLVIEIADEGRGIPPEDQAHIFDDFFRASNVEDITGAGLGLSIAKKIVDAHGGTIAVESPYQPGKSGARFTVTLPRPSAPQIPPGGPQPSDEPYLK
jgi:signal transduction histidine kinase